MKGEDNKKLEFLSFKSAGDLEAETSYCIRPRASITDSRFGPSRIGNFLDEVSFLQSDLSPKGENVASESLLEA
jgi:hypothetical protein